MPECRIHVRIIYSYWFKLIEFRIKNKFEKLFYVMKIKTNVHNPQKKSFTIVRDAKPGFGAGHSNNLVGFFSEHLVNAQI